MITGFRNDARFFCAFIFYFTFLVLNKVNKPGFKNPWGPDDINHFYL